MYKCNYHGCKYKVMKFIGICKDCDKIFCHLHRYQEAHFCKNLHDKKAQERQKLSEKLYREAAIKKSILN